MRGTIRTTLRRDDDGSHRVYINDVPEPAPMDDLETIAWLAAFVSEVAPAPPPAAELYGAYRSGWSLADRGIKRA
ncbi:hypothetical protein [Sphingomonas sp. 3-13AW]|uniref:hypothetical protein n=1 Tax=Sphingomonas sp. 3-13AW TaxID=3050450 RepID=UPI003BB63C59